MAVRRPQYECGHCTFTARSIHSLDHHVQKEHNTEAEGEDYIGNRSPSPASSTDLEQADVDVEGNASADEDTAAIDASINVADQDNVDPGGGLVSENKECDSNCVSADENADLNAADAESCVADVQTDEGNNAPVSKEGQEEDQSVSSAAKDSRLCAENLTSDPPEDSGAAESDAVAVAETNSEAEGELMRHQDRLESTQPSSSIQNIKLTTTPIMPVRQAKARKSFPRKPATPKSTPGSPPSNLQITNPDKNPIMYSLLSRKLVSENSHQGSGVVHMSAASPEAVKPHSKLSSEQDPGLFSLCITDVVSLADQQSNDATTSTLVGSENLNTSGLNDLSEASTETASETFGSPSRANSDLHTVNALDSGNATDGLIAIKTEPSGADENHFSYPVPDIWEQALEGRNVIDVQPQDDHGAFTGEQLANSEELAPYIKSEPLEDPSSEIPCESSSNLVPKEEQASTQYRCAYCDFRCSQAQDAKAHLLKHVNKTTGVGDVFQKPALSKMLQNSKHTPGFKLKCPVSPCSFVTTDSLSLGVHLYFEHKQTYKKLFYCAYCKFVSPVLKEVRKHMRGDHGSRLDTGTPEPVVRNVAKKSTSKYSDSLNILQKRARIQHMSDDISGMNQESLLSVKTQMLDAAKKVAKIEPDSDDLTTPQVTTEESGDDSAIGHLPVPTTFDKNAQLDYTCDLCFQKFKTLKQRLMHQFNDHRMFGVAKSSQNVVSEEPDSKPQASTVQAQQTQAGGGQPMNFKCYFCNYANANYEAVMKHMDDKHSKMLNQKCKGKDWTPMLLPGSWQHPGRQEGPPTQALARPRIQAPRRLPNVGQYKMWDNIPPPEPMDDHMGKLPPEGPKDQPEEKKSTGSSERPSKKKTPPPGKLKAVSKAMKENDPSRKEQREGATVLRRDMTDWVSIIHRDQGKPRVSTRGRTIKSRKPTCLCTDCNPKAMMPQHWIKRHKPKIEKETKVGKSEESPVEGHKNETGNSGVEQVGHTIVKQEKDDSTTPVPKAGTPREDVEQPHHPALEEEEEEEEEEDDLAQQSEGVDMECPLFHWAEEENEGCCKQTEMPTLDVADDTSNRDFSDGEEPMPRLDPEGGGPQRLEEPSGLGEHDYSRSPNDNASSSPKQAASHDEHAYSKAKPKEPRDYIATAFEILKHDRSERNSTDSNSGSEKFNHFALFASSGKLVRLSDGVEVCRSAMDKPKQQVVITSSRTKRSITEKEMLPKEEIPMEPIAMALKRSQSGPQLMEGGGPQRLEEPSGLGEHDYSRSPNDNASSSPKQAASHDEHAYSKAKPKEPRDYIATAFEILKHDRSERNSTDSNSGSEKFNHFALFASSGKLVRLSDGVEVCRSAMDKPKQQVVITRSRTKRSITEKEMLPKEEIPMEPIAMALKRSQSGPQLIGVESPPHPRRSKRRLDIKVEEAEADTSVEVGDSDAKRTRTGKRPPPLSEKHVDAALATICPADGVHQDDHPVTRGKHRRARTAEPSVKAVTLQTKRTRSSIQLPPPEDSNRPEQCPSILEEFLCSKVEREKWLSDPKLRIEPVVQLHDIVEAILAGRR